MRQREELKIPSDFLRKKAKMKTVALMEAESSTDKSYGGCGSTSNHSNVLESLDKHDFSSLSSNFIQGKQHIGHNPRFMAVTHCSAAGLKTVILNLTKEYGIDLTKCRGQGYDGANVMSGGYGGLQTLIKEHAPNADYVHCAAHALNLVLNDAARHVREVSTFFHNLEEIYTFFGNSIKRWAMLSNDSSEKYLITLKKRVLIS
nr:unnamed protein product [Callosobruchus analis]